MITNTMVITGSPFTSLAIDFTLVTMFEKYDVRMKNNSNISDEILNDLVDHFFKKLLQLISTQIVYFLIDRWTRNFGSCSTETSNLDTSVKIVYSSFLLLLCFGTFISCLFCKCIIVCSCSVDLLLFFFCREFIFKKKEN